MDKTRLKHIFKQISVVLMGVLLLLSLALPLIKITSYGNVFYADTGFRLLTFKSNVPEVDNNAPTLSIFLGLFAFFQLILSFALIATGIIGLFIENEKIEKANLISIIIGLLFSFWYMIEGILYSTIYTPTTGYNATTTAWLSFVLCFLPFIAYLFCKYYVQNNDALINDNRKAKTNNLTLLKQYKELLDDGIITQEEFNEKKKELI
ncbi:MAG: SHOCT domain-containing protein [Christensenellaceae bacterium]